MPTTIDSAGIIFNDGSVLTSASNLSSIETGSNTVLGQDAFASNATGVENVALGSQALNKNVIGNQNVAIGAHALENNIEDFNTAIGDRALYNNTTGSSNVAIGDNALLVNLTGSCNTAVGTRALSACTATGNTAVGFEAGNALIGGTYNVFVGYDAQASNNVNPQYQIVIGTGAKGVADDTVSIGKAGNVISNTFTSNATWTRTSDERLKTDIQNDTVGLSFIKKLRPVTFKLKPTNELDPSLPAYNETNLVDSELLRRGFIAQEVKAAIDSENIQAYIGWDEGTDGIQHIGETAFVTPLVNAVKELSNQIEDLKAEIEILKQTK